MSYRKNRTADTADGAQLTFLNNDPASRGEGSTGLQKRASTDGNKGSEQHKPSPALNRQQAIAEDIGNRLDTSRAPSKHRSPVPADALPAKRAVRRPELRRIVPLSDTTIYEMEQRGDFPKRFYLTPRCAAWDLEEVMAWLGRWIEETSGRPSDAVPMPDVRTRKSRPVKRSDRKHRQTHQAE